MISEREGQKRCHRCGEYKPFEKFYRSTTTSDGFKGACLDCRIEDDFVWARALEYWNYQCAVCGSNSTGRHRTLARDHWFIPSAKGGKLTAQNLIPLCHPCNSSKSDGDWMKFLVRRLGAEVAAAKAVEIQAYFSWVVLDDSPDNAEAINRKCAEVRVRMGRSHYLKGEVMHIQSLALDLTDNREQARVIARRILDDLYAEAVQYLDSQPIDPTP